MDGTAFAWEDAVGGADDLKRSPQPQSFLQTDAEFASATALQPGRMECMCRFVSEGQHRVRAQVPEPPLRRADAAREPALIEEGPRGGRGGGGGGGGDGLMRQQNGAGAARHPRGTTERLRRAAKPGQLEKEHDAAD